MRPILLIFALTLILANTSNGQIAAPSLAPFGLGEITANPAALQWERGSSLGLAASSGDFETLNNGIVDPQFSGDFGATILEARAAGMNFSAGIQLTKAEINLGDATNGSTDIELSTQSVAIAARIGDMITVGLGVENTKNDFTQTSPSQSTDTNEFSLPLLGATVRLADVLYFGAAFGEETVSTSGTNAGGSRSAPDIKRGVVRGGVAYRTESKDSPVHLEVYLENREAFSENTSGGGIDKIEELETTGLTAEVIWSNILLSLHYLSITQTDFDSSINLQSELETTVTDLTVGWLPEQGFGLIVSVASEETESVPNTGVSQTVDTVTVGVNYAF